MAQKRMFSLQIVDTDAFLEMPATSQLLYFHLGMRADDDGFVSNPKKIMKITNSQDDDLKILLGKRFLIGFDSGVVVIKHWKINNYIQNDRYKETGYRDEKSSLLIKENGAYTECIQDVSSLETQYRLDKVSIDKISIAEHSEVYRNKYFTVNNIQHDIYLKAYPDIKIIPEYNKMESWLESNPKKRKSDYPRFINNWLGKAQKEFNDGKIEIKSQYQTL